MIAQAELKSILKEPIENIEFIGTNENEELEEMKRQVAFKMGYELVDHRLELFGKKIKN